MLRRTEGEWATSEQWKSLTGRGQALGFGIGYNVWFLSLEPSIFGGMWGGLGWAGLQVHLLLLS